MVGSISFASTMAILSTISTTMAASIHLSNIQDIHPRGSNPNVVSVVCVAGQCIEGYANISLGAQLKSNSHPLLTLLPGQYTSNTSPQLLHDALTESGSTLTSQSGINASSTSTISLPLNVQLQPGIVSYSQSLYGGESSYTSLTDAFSLNSSNGTSPSNNATSITGSAFVLSQNTFAALVSSSNTRIVIYDSIPDVSQLPSGSASDQYKLTAVSASSCSTQCSSGGVCDPSTATCVCPTGFAGQACETCSTGFFGPSCLPCPANCAHCDDGPTGTGFCLAPANSTSPSSCNCLSGICDGNGGCTCSTGWTTASNGTLCGACQPGFFLNSNGTCEACSLGCSQCIDGSGDCLICASGFTADINTRAKCDPVPTSTAGGACVDGSFANGGNCQQCSSLCKTCTGPTSNDCIVCAQGLFKLSSSSSTCVPADSNGVCQVPNSNSSLIGNGPKGVCDTCPKGCLSCAIPGFTPFSQVSSAQCTKCFPGLVLNNGQCVSSCPSGSFLGSDGMTCQQCDSSCSTCAGNAKFCLTCSTSNQVASNGTCTSTCPPSTFSQNGACLPCHADCASCTGAGFNQCSTCRSARPVFESGRCLLACSKGSFFDNSNGGNGGCSACDKSCSTCSASGVDQCLSCPSGNILQQGRCVPANCKGGASAIDTLGVCLETLVFVPSPSNPSASALPSITGLSSPVAASNHLKWYEILLMVLGCVFIFLVVLWLFRRRMVKKRKLQTREFMLKRELDVHSGGWRERLRRIFGKRVKLEGETELSVKGRGSSKEGSSKQRYRDEDTRGYGESIREFEDGHRRYRSSWNEFDNESVRSRSTAPSVSVYSRSTGYPLSSRRKSPPPPLPERRTPEPRTMVRNAPALTGPGDDLDGLLNNRFSHNSRTAPSVNTMKTEELISLFKPQATAPALQPSQADLISQSQFQAQQPFQSQSTGGSLTAAQTYAHSVNGSNGGPAPGAYWLTPHHTGSSTQSKNPFLRP